MKLGFIGLGKMGNRMVMKLLGGGHEVVVWNRSKEKVVDLESEVSNEDRKNLKVAESFSDFTTMLAKPRIVWSMLPAGEATEAMLFGEGGAVRCLEAGDILIDGGNAHFPDTQRRFENLKSMEIKFLGIGVSGGLVAFEAGYPMMVGGDKDAFDYIGPILETLAKPSGGFEYFGEGGAGHFVKMVHNGIEYGYMQAIGEGFGILEKSPYNLDLLKVSKLYEKGTLLSGFMMERTIEALTNDPQMEKVAGVIGSASGEAVWTVDFAKENGLPVEIIGRSLEIRRESETDERIQKSYFARMVGSLRIAFGGHPVRQASIDSIDDNKNKIAKK